MTSCRCDSKIVRYNCMSCKNLNISTNVRGRLDLQSLTRNILVRLRHPLQGCRPIIGRSIVRLAEIFTSTYMSENKAH